MARSLKSRQIRRGSSPAGSREAALRVIGGKFRGRSLAYTGDRRTRPMKDRTREAVFNLLGPSVKGKHAIDLFAGSGAIGLEAISRGAARAIFIERHLPSVRSLQQNVAKLGIEDSVQVAASDTFFWAQKFVAMPAGWKETPWVVFCSPPYDLYVEQPDKMDWLIQHFTHSAPVGSLIVVEADGRFDVHRLPQIGPWDIRQYPPATIAILEIR